MPVAHVGRDGHDIARANDERRLALLLHEALSLGDDQRLTERMGMPGRPRTGRERDGRSTGRSGKWRLKG